MKLYFSIAALFFAFFFVEVHANEVNEEGVILRYREYERFDFEDLTKQRETGSPGDLSITPRFQRQFNNQLPYRKNFNAEIIKAVERTR